VHPEPPNFGGRSGPEFVSRAVTGCENERARTRGWIDSTANPPVRRGDRVATETHPAWCRGGADYPRKKKHRTPTRMGDAQPSLSRPFSPFCSSPPRRAVSPSRRCCCRGERRQEMGPVGASGCRVGLGRDRSSDPMTGQLQVDRLQKRDCRTVPETVTAISSDPAVTLSLPRGGA